MLYGRFLADGLLVYRYPRGALGALFPVLTSNRSQRARGRTEKKVEAEVMSMKEEQYEQRQPATAASRCKESYAGERARAEGRRVTRERKIRAGKEGEGERENLPIREEQRRDRGLAQKRANVDKIGGGSLQLLAGMSGNAWDSNLKARPRQSPFPPSPSLPFVLSFSLSSLLPTFINGYSMRPLPCTG